MLLESDYTIFTNIQGYIGIFKKQGDLYDMVYLENLGLTKEIAHIKMVQSD